MYIQNSNHVFNSKEESFDSIKKDVEFLNLHKQKYFCDISIEKTYEFSEKKHMYKQYLKNTEQDSIFQQYKKLVAELREEKLPFRVIDILKKGGNSYFNNVSYFSNKNDLSSSTEVKKLMEVVELSKTERKKILHEHEVQWLKKCSLPTFELASKINWLHGTNSSLLPFLPYTEYSLIPTGMLLDKGIAPMCGEIFKGGMKVDAVNQKNISVETIKGLSRCWEYASEISHSFKADNYNNPKSIFEEAIQKLIALTPDHNSWDATLISLYRLKQWNPEEFQSLCDEHCQTINQIKEKLSNNHSYIERIMLKALDYDSKKLMEAVTNEVTLAQVKKDFPDLDSSSMWDDCKTNEKNCYRAIGYLVADEQREKELEQPVFNIIYRGFFLNVIMLKMYGQEDIKEIDEKRNDQTLHKRFGKQNQCLWKKIIKYDSEGDYPNIQNVLNNKLRPIMELRIKKNALPYAKRLLRFERLFEDKPFINLTELDKTHLIKPIPMLLASTKSKSNGTFESTRETHVKQPFFGRDIDLIFVENDHIKTINLWLAEHQLENKIHVYATSFLEDLKNIPLYHSSRQVNLSEPYMSQKALENMLEIVQNQVIPLYQQPYSDGNDRKWHGVAHALRVLLFSHVIGSLYKEAKLSFLTTSENLHIAAALHDSARLNDGVDLWDKESGQICKDVLIKNGASVEEADLLAHAIAEKDNNSPTCSEQKVIHDADCIEILRGLKSEKDFISEKLWIIRELDKEIGYQFIEEAKILIKLTEMSEVKTFLEISKEPLKCLYQILFHVNNNYGKCELLGLHLQHSQDLFDLPGQYLLDQNIEKIIENYLNE